MTLTEFQKNSTNLGRACAVALGASLPFSTALDSVLLILALLCWVAGGGYRKRLETWRGNPVVLASASFVALLALGLIYGERTESDALHYFGKYADLLLVGVFVTWFDDALWRRRALFAFAASVALLLLLSYLIRFGVIPPNYHIYGDIYFYGTPANPVVLKLWITHNILMAFGAYLFVLFGLQAQQLKLRVVWYGLAVLAAGNVVFMIQGRTGYLVLVLLALYLGFVCRRYTGLVVAALFAGAVITTAFVLPSTLHERTELAVEEFHQAQPKVASQTSVGRRLEFYRNSLAIIHGHPLIGVGTGGFPYAYEKQIAGTDMEPTRNPHNEYLHILVQLGLIGFVALLALFWVPWRVAPLLPTWQETQIARGLVLTIAAGCVFNSLLIDHTERLLFAWGLGVLFAGLQSPLTVSPFKRA
jgi:O-antigen ligase